jgi:DNA-binding GntR family transcriptional regulator
MVTNPLSKRNRAGDALEELAASLGPVPTISSRIAAILRRQIIDGTLKPGERIVETRLAKELKIGQPTVRESLIALEHEGLVERKPNCGCSVVKLSMREIDQIYQVRLELEPLAAELAVENRGDLKAIQSAFEEMKQAARKGERETWNRSDLRFHETLWRISGNPFLERNLIQIAVPFFAFAKIVYVQGPPIDLVSQAEDHGRIVSALASGDKDLAKQTTREVLLDFRQFWAGVPEFRD